MPYNLLKKLLEEKTTELQESDSRLYAIFEQSQFSIQIFNSKGKTILVNPAWKKLWGLNDEFINSFILNEYNILEDPLLDAKGITSILKETLKGKSVKIPPFYYDPKEVGLPGTAKYTEAIAYPIKDDNDGVKEVVLIHEDITEKKLILDRSAFLHDVVSILLESIDYDKTIEKIASATLPFLADGCIVDVVENGEIKRILTKHINPHTENVMRELQRRFPPHIDSPQPTVRVLKSKEPEVMEEVTSEIIRKSTINEEHFNLIKNSGLNSHIAVPLILRGTAIGALNFWRSENRPFFDENDLVLARDVGRHAALAIENARLYRDSQSAIQQREDFISIASHELKTPVTALKLQMEVLKRISSGKLVDSDKPHIRRVTASANRQIDKMNLLIEEMLDLSRISKGLNLSLKEVELAPLVEEVLDRFSEQLEENNIVLTRSLEPDIIINCEAYRIEQIITNLMTNAIRYGSRNPIEVILKKDNGKAFLEIKDNGKGIKENELEKIFEKFERGSENLDGKGLGLGLYISRRIAEEHNGKLYAQSVLGKGSIFTLELNFTR